MLTLLLALSGLLPVSAPASAAGPTSQAHQVSLTVDDQAEMAGLRLCIPFIGCL